MVLPALLALATIGCYHHFRYAGGRGSAMTDTSAVELHVLDQYLAGGNVSGWALMSSQSMFADATAFKEHLVMLLRANSDSLAQLSERHVEVEVRNAHVLPTFSERYMWAPAHGAAPAAFVPKSVAIDFDVGFNHSQRISRKALEESLRRVVSAGAKVWPEDLQDSADLRRTQTCSTSFYEERCKTMCEDDQYLMRVCSNCGCEGYEGTPSCTCFIQTTHFGLSIASNSIYAILMCLCGVIFCRKTAYAKPNFVDTEIPNIGGGDFKDGIFSCMDHMPICCTTCCCPIIQPSITNQVSGVGDFCRTLILLGIAYAIPGAIGLVVLFPLVICCYRRKMRVAAKMSRDTCMDCICSFCCPLCVICQEARHFEEAARIAFPDEPDWKKAKSDDFDTIMDKNKNKKKDETPQDPGTTEV